MICLYVYIYIHLHTPTLWFSHLFVYPLSNLFPSARPPPGFFGTSLPTNWTAEEVAFYDQLWAALEASCPAPATATEGLDPTAFLQSEPGQKGHVHGFLWFRMLWIRFLFCGVNMCYCIVCIYIYIYLYICVCLFI